MSTTIDAAFAVIKDEAGNVLLDTSDAQTYVILTNVDDTPPEVRKSIVAIPGRNGDLDLSDALTGYPVYTSRTLVLTFAIGEGLKDASTHPNRTDSYETYHDLMGDIHGKMCHVEYTEQTNTYGSSAYMRGRASFSAPSYIEGALEFSVEFDCDPWIYTGTQTQSVTRSGSGDFLGGVYGTAIRDADGVFNMSNHQIEIQTKQWSNDNDHSWHMNMNKVKIKVFENGANIFDINSAVVNPYGTFENTSFDKVNDSIVITCNNSTFNEFGCYLFEDDNASAVSPNGSAWHMPNYSSVWTDQVVVFSNVELLNGGTLPEIYLKMHLFTPDGTENIVQYPLCNPTQGPSYTYTVYSGRGASDFYMQIVVWSAPSPFKLTFKVQQTPRQINSSELLTWYKPNVSEYVIDLLVSPTATNSIAYGDVLSVSPALSTFQRKNESGELTAEYTLDGVALRDALIETEDYTGFVRAYVESNGTVNHRWTIFPYVYDRYFVPCDAVTIDAGIMPTVLNIETQYPIKLKRDGVTGYVTNNAPAPFEFKPGNNTFEVTVYGDSVEQTQFAWNQGVI